MWSNPCQQSPPTRFCLGSSLLRQACDQLSESGGTREPLAFDAARRGLPSDGIGPHDHQKEGPQLNLHAWCQLTRAKVCLSAHNVCLCAHVHVCPHHSGIGVYLVGGADSNHASGKHRAAAVDFTKQRPHSLRKVVRRQEQKHRVTMGATLGTSSKS